MQNSETSEQSPASRPQPEREMGLWMAIALVVGNMPRTGGPYAYARRAFGELGRGRGGPRCMSCPIERDALTNP